MRLSQIYLVPCALGFLLPYLNGIARFFVWDVVLPATWPPTVATLRRYLTDRGRRSVA